MSEGFPTPNSSIELTRRAVCLLGGRGFGHDSGMQWRCNLPAARLMLSVVRLKVRHQG